MDDRAEYSISSDIEYGPLELIDIPILIETSRKKWQNFSLCEVNDCVIRLGVIHGEFHWHKHDNEDEFFYVIDGLLHMDLKEKTYNDIQFEVRTRIHGAKGYTSPNKGSRTNLDSDG